VPAFASDHRTVTERPKRIVLVGMMGSGKSTVGRALAEELGWPLLDNDMLVRETTGRGGPEIFRTGGEAALHEAEREALIAAIRRPAPAVITAAASVVDEARLRSMLLHVGTVVWLRAAVETIVDRIDANAGAGRRSDARDVALLEERAAHRAPLYTEVADAVVDVDGRTVDELVVAIRAAAAV
jgi:shikimate kinase